MVYQDVKSLEQKFEIAKHIHGLHGIELSYPADFTDYSLLKKLLAESGLGVSAINFRCRRSGMWFRGSFTSADDKDRYAMVDDFKKCMESAKNLGVPRITTCPLNEGQDYLFELDYYKAYDAMKEALIDISAHAAQTWENLKICIEYKFADPRTRCFISSAGEALAMCQEVDKDNIGITLDFGHALQAQERPGQSVAMLSRAKKLFYVHQNDNDRYFDWDLIPGAFNVWDNIEFFYYLKKSDYDGWIAFDVFPKELNTVEVFNTAVFTTNKLIEITNRLDEAKMEELLGLRNPAKTMRYLFELI
jgi:xylose isomerase